MRSPLSDPQQRIAFFQQWFSDTIPHSKALGLKIIAVRRGFGSMQLDWREELVGNPETGVLAGGPTLFPYTTLFRSEHSRKSVV